MSGSGKIVCVTGASGFVGSWLVKVLLDRGYIVKATVRDLADPKKTKHLLELDGAKERLYLFKADLMQDASFDSVVADCECVFHAASPVFHHSKNPQEELIDPAVKGTLNVLNSVAKTPSVRRVVFTSSAAAIVFGPNLHIPGFVFDETCFSDEDFCKDYKMWYRLSKTLAEKSAWNFVEERGIDMVTINPGLVIGPSLDPSLNSGAAEILKLINVATSYRNTSMAWVHVKDVVEAHIQAFENQSANGRYCLVESVAHYSEIVGFLRELYPNLWLPDNCVRDETCVPKFQVSKEKTKALGIDYIPLKECVKDTVESLKEQRFVTLNAQIKVTK